MSDNNNNGYLTANEIASELRVTPMTVYNWIKAGKLKAFRFGDVYRIRKDDYQEFLKTGESVKGA